ncbi:S8 family peptidase [Aequorivita echinoideorum]|uniref:S8 family serine peptidase n=1 Tax=Aequorivita echinoideorum TaxID=1549647 RepID=A0ABS5S6N6_9FLAO|nr:S8 family serine peptidase [Aequorivita echinoideorum]MBT0608844.1 S8 family serine peptidase [Aequorivita echinoideorum]
MKQIILIIFIFFCTNAFTQNETWFYLVAKDSTVNPIFMPAEGNLQYAGNNPELKQIFSKYKIRTFKKTLKNAKKENLNKTFFVIADKEFLLEELLQKSRNIFISGQIIPKEQRKIFEPNDYGLTSTIGSNIGLQAHLDYLDFLEVPKAWYYTVGNPNIIIGISDTGLDTTDTDFAGKTKIIRKSIEGGHGKGVASLAAATGNNAFGVPGVCYNCGIYSTTYGDFKNLDQLLELSNLGVKVINCSWYSTTRFDSAQEAVNKMFENGTILVVAAGNKNWQESKNGERLYYLASYDNVISVSSAMYKYKTVEENVVKSEKGFRYAENILGYVGRTMGFKDNDISKPYIYPVSVTSLNREVDILAPSTGTFLYGNYLEKSDLVYDTNEHTSNATPLVTGTVGLMFSLYPCLPVDEVESILKMTSLNIDHIEANKPYAGKYGAGILNTGRAVEMVFDMFAENEVVTIENQKFSRWDFKLTSHSEVLIKNQEFTENATLNLTSKKRIVIAANTILKPSETGKIQLKINPNLERECELQLRDPSILDD